MLKNLLHTTILSAFMVSISSMNADLKSQLAYNFPLNKNQGEAELVKASHPSLINDDGFVNRESSSYVGLYFGQRNFSSVPNDVFFQNSEDNLTSVDLGKGRPFIIGLQMMFQNAENGFAFPLQIEGFLGNSSGFTLNLGGGYKIGNQRFSFTPNITAGIGRIWTSISSIDLEDSVIPASFFEEGNGAWFVGPTASNLDRGPGSNISFTAGSLFFQAKASANISYSVSEKMVLFADAGYNYLITSGNNKFELSGKGYDSINALTDPNGAPPNIITAEPDASKGLVNQNRVPYKKTPYDLSGIQFQFGIGITAGN